MKSKPITVMLVEDEMMLQEVYTIVLKANGYNVIAANNGKEALAAIKKSCPDIILLDMLMPVMGGAEFMRTIKLRDYPNTKVIVYSNLSDSSVEAEMLELGASRFVLKSSMAPKDLIRMIQTYAAS